MSDTQTQTDTTKCGKCGEPVTPQPVTPSRQYARAYHHEKYTCVRCGHMASVVTRLQGAWTQCK